MAAGLSLKGAQAQVPACVTASTFPGGRVMLVALFLAPSRSVASPSLRAEAGTARLRLGARGQSLGRGVVGFRPRLLGCVGPVRPSLSSLQPRHGPSGSWRYHEARFCWFPALLFLTKAFPAVILANSAATSSLPRGGIWIQEP